MEIADKPRRDDDRIFALDAGKLDKVGRQLRRVYEGLLAGKGLSRHGRTRNLPPSPSRSPMRPTEPVNPLQLRVVSEPSNVHGVRYRNPIGQLDSRATDGAAMARKWRENLPVAAAKGSPTNLNLA